MSLLILLNMGTLRTITILLLFVPTCVVFCPFGASAMSQKESGIQNCYDDRMGVRFLCDPDWELVEGEDVILLVVSEDPAVTITISKTKTPIKFLEQIDKQSAAKIGDYKEGFQMEILRLAKVKALEIKAISVSSPETYLLDYYVLHENYLYGLLFSAQMQSAWDEYQALFHEIADSFQVEPAGEIAPGQGPLQYFYGE